MLLARVYLDAEQPAAAETEREGAVAQGIPRAGVLDLLGRALLGQGKFDQVLAEPVPADDQPAARLPGGMRGRSSGSPVPCWKQAIRGRRRTSCAGTWPVSRSRWNSSCF